MVISCTLRAWPTHCWKTKKVHETITFLLVNFPRLIEKQTSNRSSTATHNSTNPDEDRSGRCWDNRSDRNRWKKETAAKHIAGWAKSRNSRQLKLIGDPRIRIFSWSGRTETIKEQDCYYSEDSDSPHRSRQRHINPSYSPGGANVHLSNTWLFGPSESPAVWHFGWFIRFGTPAQTHRQQTTKH